MERNRIEKINVKCRDILDMIDDVLKSEIAKNEKANENKRIALLQDHYKRIEKEYMILNTLINNKQENVSRRDVEVYLRKVNNVVDAFLRDFPEFNEEREM